MTSSHIILYDGVCGLCNRLNRFVLRRDPEVRFRYASLQSSFAHRVLRRYGKDPADLDTLYVIARPATESEQLFDRSQAALFILKELGGLWRIVSWVRFLPRFVLDSAYDWVARNRYRIFGKYDACPLPRPEDRDKFIDLSGGEAAPVQTSGS